MSTFSLLNSFLVVFIVFQTFSVHNFTYGSPKTVTGELIHTICNHARNHSLCLETLQPLKGKDLADKPLLTLGEKPLNMSIKQAMRTSTAIWNLHQRIRSRTRIPVQMKLKERYYKCHLKYSDIRQKLPFARVSMKEEDKKAVNGYTSAAMNQASACEDVFRYPPREPSSVPKEVGMLKDSLSIILAICEKLK